MKTLPIDDSRAVALVAALQSGDTTSLERMLHETPTLATTWIVDRHGIARSLLHVVADWPGHRPNASRAIASLVAAGADVNARLVPTSGAGAPETALHWAASNDDVALMDALLDHGADIEADGAIHTGGTPMSDAVVFAQWNAARRLIERGASTTIWQAAALGLLDRVRAHCTADPPPTAEAITNAFWNACRGGQQTTAEYLLNLGADPRWIGHEHKTPLDVAHESGDESLVRWLTARLDGSSVADAGRG